MQGNLTHRRSPCFWMLPSVICNAVSTIGVVYLFLHPVGFGASGAQN